MEKKDLDPRILKVAEGIKRLRKEAGYTSHETFAFENDLPRQHYWQVEKGSNITLNTLLRILDIHKVSVEEFARKNNL